MADAIRQIGVSEGDLLSVAPGVCRAEDRASCRGIPAYMRFDNGPQFVAKAVQELIAVVSAKTAYIERGSPWENGYIERLQRSPARELLDGEIFYTLREAQIVMERLAAPLQLKTIPPLPGSFSAVLAPMSHLLPVVDDRWSNAPRVVAASSIRDC